MATQRFYDGQPGPDIRRELNNLEAVFDDAIANARGPRGWTPVVSVVTDGARRVLRITDWTGGEGSKPTVTGFIGATGIVATAALAVDIRGSIGATGPSNTLAIGTVTSAASPSATITGTSPNQTLNLVLPKGDKGDTGNTGPANTLTIGTVTTGAASATITGTAPSQVLNLVIPQGIQGLQGPQGPKGDTGPQGVQGLAGLHGWTPKFAVVTDGARRVQQVVDWFGGTGSKPATGEYVGATGLVATIAQAVDIRGPSGSGTGNVNPTGVIAADDLAAFADSTGEVIKPLKAADLPVSTATQTALDGKAPLNGTGTSGIWPISTTGNAATATKLATGRAINGVNFDGTADISVSVDWASVTGKPAVIATGADAAAARTAIGAGTSNLTDAPIDGKQYTRKDAAWAEVVTGGGVGPRNWYVSQHTASGTFVVPSGVTVIRPYSFGAGADGGTTHSGGGGGCAYGDIAVTPGTSVTLSIVGGVAKLTYGGADLLIANPASGVTGGTASKHASVANGGAYSGGAGSTGIGAGGGSSGSPLGVGINGVDGGGSGWGGNGAGYSGGGVGGPSNSYRGGDGLPVPSTDPILNGLTALGGAAASSATGAVGGSGGAGGGGGYGNGTGGQGGFGGGGGYGNDTGGQGGFGGGGGGGGVGGSGGAGGGGGYGDGIGGAGGSAVIRIYY